MISAASHGFMGIQIYESSRTHAAEGVAVLQADALGNAEVYQKIKTEQGGLYELSLGYNPGMAAWRDNTKDIDIFWGDEKLARVIGDRHAWTRHRFYVRADKKKTTLTFKAVGRSDGQDGLDRRRSLV